MTETRIFSTPGADDGTAQIKRLPGQLHIQPAAYPAVDTVVTHWEALRGNNPAPARSAIDPRTLASCLDVLFVAEHVAPGVARLRLCGQQFTNLLGMEPRGMPLSVFFAAEARDNLATALKQVAQGVRAVLPLRAEKGLGRPGLDGVLALMPLADRNGNITRILGVLETHGQIGRAPRKFRLAAPLPDSLAEIPPGTQRQARTPVTAPERPRGKPFLRLIKGGLGN